MFLDQFLMLNSMVQARIFNNKAIQKLFSILGLFLGHASTIAPPQYHMSNQTSDDNGP